MITINLEYEELEMLDRVLCGVFNGDYQLSFKVTNYLRRAVKEYEVPGVYKILYSLMYGGNANARRVLYKGNFSRELLLSQLDNSIVLFIRRRERQYEEYIKREELAFNLKSPKDIQEFAHYMYGETIKKYDDIVSYNVEEVESWMEELGKALKRRAVEEIYLNSGMILNSGMEFGKQFLIGTEDAIKYSKEEFINADKRYEVNDTDADRYTIDEINSPESMKEFEDRQRAMNGGEDDIYKEILPIKWGVNTSWSIRRRDIIVIVGEEGTGKTKYLIDTAYEALCNNIDVALVCTEIEKDVIFNMIIARMLYDKEKWELSETFLMSLRDLIKNCDVPSERREAEENLAKIEKHKVEFFSNPNHGALCLIQNMRYDYVEDKVSEFCKQHGDIRKEKILMIDSSSFLDKPEKIKYGDSSTTRTSIEEMMKDLVKSKADTGLATIITTHPSAEAAKDLSKGKTVTSARITADSSSLSKWGKTVILMSATEQMKKNNLINFRLNKGRYIGNPSVVLRRIVACNHYIYEEKNQIKDTTVEDLNSEELYRDMED